MYIVSLAILLLYVSDVFIIHNLMIFQMKESWLSLFLTRRLQGWASSLLVVFCSMVHQGAARP